MCQQLAYQYIEKSMKTDGLPSTPSPHTLLMMLGLFTISLLAFWPGVSGGFLFDDYHNIVTNSHVQIKDLSGESLWRAANAYSDKTRQLAMLTFALNAHWAGLEPWAYKVTGLGVHAFNAVLVGLLSLRLLAFSTVINERQRIWAAFALALVWALHPLQVSSALYIVQRMETLCFTFLFIAMLVYLKARCQQIAVGRSQKSLWAVMALSTLLAFLSKESAVLLPLFLLALELTVLGFASASARQAHLLRIFYGAGTLLALIVFLTFALPHYYSAELHVGRDFNTAQRILTQFRVLVLYLQQILMPLPSTLYFYYDDLTVSTGWLSPVSTLLSALFLTALLGFAAYVRKRYPLAALGIMLFFASHFLTSNIIPLEMVFEHRNYFAVYGILLVVVELITRLPIRDGPGIKYFGVAALVVGFAFLGAVRAATWGNVFLLATDMAQTNPKSARAGMDLGVAYYEMSGGDSNSPFYQFAAREFDRVSSFPHASTQPMVNLILMDSSGGLPNDLVDIAAVWNRYLERLQRLHLGAETRTSVWSLLEQRMKGRAIDDDYLSQALEVIFIRADQDDYRHAQAADYYLNTLGTRDLAIEHYKSAIQKANASGNTRLVEAIYGGLVDRGSFDLILQLAK